MPALGERPVLTLRSRKHKPPGFYQSPVRLCSDVHELRSAQQLRLDPHPSPNLLEPHRLEVLWTYMLAAPISRPSTEKDVPLFDKKETYTPAEAKRAYAQLDQLVSEKTISARQAGAHRRHIASRVRITLKPVYNAQAAKRAKTEIGKLTEAGTITMKSAAAYRAHITKRTFAI